MGRWWVRGCVVGIALAVAACGSEEEAAVVPAPTGDVPESPVVAEVPPSGAARIDDLALVRAELDRGNWITHGRTYSEQRFSRLSEVNDQNVGRLGRLWTFETGLDRGHEATPIVVDGVMYLTGSWSVVFALDARTGELIWRYDPEVSKEDGQKACCDVVNRGVAVYDGKIYAGVLDGRLVALDATTGGVVWSTVTVDQTKNYTITGAPRIVEGKVIIGNGGAELGVRGYVSAYSAQTGDLVWRTYTVPGDPNQPQASVALDKAVKTWKGGEWWKIGGGGTAWDSMAYDPKLKLLYVGTGNGSPWTRHIRSPGGGDNLYLSSILALNPSNGELVWHYQTTPGDNWDFTATQHMILADLEIAGTTRNVIMQAPKNGFFYVLDRQSGELISAQPYVEVTWAEGVDPATGRPIEIPAATYKDGLAIVQPTPFGGHNWHPMSFSPLTGLVYVPAQEIVGAYRLQDDFEYDPAIGAWNTGTDFNTFAIAGRDGVTGHLLAWDPVKQAEAWRVQYALPWNGGVLSTAGDLVFQGTADGRLIAVRASDGKSLWEDHAGTGVIAAPITYEVDGRQYVTVVAGWGGAFALVGGAAAKHAGVGSKGRVLTYALDTASLPTAPQIEERITRTGGLYDGERLYHENCAVCHGSGAVGGGVLPDLRESAPAILTALEPIVLGGALRGAGMPSFAGRLAPEEVAKIADFIRDRASER